MLNIAQLKSAPSAARRNRVRVLVSRSRTNRLAAVPEEDIQLEAANALVPDPTPAANEARESVVVLDVPHAEEPPFDPPDADDDIFCGAEACEPEDDVEPFVAANDDAPELCEDEFEAPAVEALNETPPSEPALQADTFDAPDADDPIFRSGSLKRAPPAPVEGDAPQGPADRRSPVAVERTEEAAATEQPVPAFRIYACWDREQVGDTLQRLGGDQRMARAEIEVERGGLERAIARFQNRPSPDLLIIDSHQTGDDILAGLDRLAHVLEAGAKVIVIGGVNDITFLRELAARGISDYMVAPMRRDDLARAICGLYAEGAKARVIAVVGACGGVGASTIAHNIAWSIAERQEAGVTLIDLDLSFGAAAFSFKREIGQSVIDVLSAPADADESVLDRALTPLTKRLRLLPAPANVAQEYTIDDAALDGLIARARRLSPYVVLDLPHEWNSWVKRSLIVADDVLVVAGPDLAGLRNTKNFLDLMQSARPHASRPVLALSMLGVPKRPEILAKDFAQSLRVEPAACFTFEPELFGMAGINGQMLGEASPQSKAAQTIDSLATIITGRRPITLTRTLTRPATFNVRKLAEGAPASAAPRPVVAPAAPAASPAPAPAAAPAVEPQPLTLESVAEAEPPPPPGDYIERARDAALAERASPRRARAPQSSFGARALLAVALVLCALRVETDRLALAAAPRHDADFMSLAAEAPAPAPMTAPDFTVGYADAVSQFAAGHAGAAIAWLQRAADAGFVMAQYRLALAYERGEGGPQDMARARQWTERAAAGGNRLAMHNLGVYFAGGEGGPVDEAAAFRWFRQAAEFGVPDSQYNLGILYQRGRGVTADQAEALFWFTLAARQGDAQATARVTEVEAVLEPADVAQARARAEAFRPRAADALANGEFPPRAVVASAG